MCYERWRTRDRLLRYSGTIIPPRPHTPNIVTVYPWEDIPLSILSHQLYLVAKDNGYNGSEDKFLERFASGTSEGGSGGIITGTISTFPVPGEEDILYLDTETDILYYFKIAQRDVAAEVAAQYGAEVVGRNSSGAIYVYIPIRALPMEPLFIDCGTSTDIID